MTSIAIFTIAVTVATLNASAHLIKMKCGRVKNYFTTDNTIMVNIFVQEQKINTLVL